MPTLLAMQAASRRLGGSTPLFRALQNANADTMAFLSAAGAGAEPKDVQAIEDAVYLAGVEDSIDRLTRFATLCSDGGRDASPSLRVIRSAQLLIASASSADGTLAELNTRFMTPTNQSGVGAAPAGDAVVASSAMIVFSMCGSVAPKPGDPDPDR